MRPAGRPAGRPLRIKRPGPGFDPGRLPKKSEDTPGSNSLPRRNQPQCTVAPVKIQIDNPRLIREGAAGLVENFGDVLDGMGIGFLPGLRPGDEVSEGGVAYVPDSPSDLSAEAQKVYALLDGRELSFDTLVEESGFDTGSLLAILMRLEMKMLVEHGADQVYRRSGR